MCVCHNKRLLTYLLTYLLISYHTTTTTTMMIIIRRPPPAETCAFLPLAFETHGATHFSALDFLNAVGGRIIRRSPINHFSVSTYIGFNSAFQCYFDRQNFSSSGRSIRPLASATPNAFLPRDARSAKRGIAIVSRPSVRPSVCNVDES